MIDLSFYFILSCPCLLVIYFYFNENVSAFATNLASAADVL